MKYQKKPIVIDAIQLKDCQGYNLPQWLIDAITAETVAIYYNLDGNRPINQGEVNSAIISTLEGEMMARPDDWIIRGIQGEIYPCKPDLFAATYRPITAPAQDLDEIENSIVNRQWQRVTLLGLDYVLYALQAYRHGTLYSATGTLVSIKNYHNVTPKIFNQYLEKAYQSALEQLHATITTEPDSTDSS